jgi:hypothetical protein
VLADRDVGRDLDGAAVDVEEAEAVAATGGLQLAGLTDQAPPATRCAASESTAAASAAPKEIRSSRLSWTGAAG